jgi:hypothetical protein
MSLGSLGVDNPLWDVLAIERINILPTDEKPLGIPGVGRIIYDEKGRVLRIVGFDVRMRYDEEGRLAGIDGIGPVNRDEKGRLVSMPGSDGRFTYD